VENRKQTSAEPGRTNLAGMRIKHAAPRHAGQDSAYTLTEVLAAVFVVAIMAAAFYSAVSFGFGLVQNAREDLRATQIMMQKAEAIRLCAWSGLGNFSFRDTYDPSGALNNTSGATYFGTVVTNAASSIPNTTSYADKVRLVTITVNWTNYNGSFPVAHIRQMQTQVARYGLQQYVWGMIP